MVGWIGVEVPGEQVERAREKRKHAKGAQSDTDLDAKDLAGLVEELKAIVKRETGKPFPAEPHEQLRLAVEAVFGSWFGPRAKDYRKQFKISDDLGTACSGGTMGFGNMGDDSGTRVALTRRPNTGEET